MNFTDPPTQRGTGLLRNLRGAGERYGGGDNAGAAETPADARSVYPCTIHHNARVGGSHILYAESAQARTDWRQKLEEALGLRRVVQESNKVFELETLSADTFLVPSLVTPPTAPAYHENSLTGKVTCSVPFSKRCFVYCQCSKLDELLLQILRTGGGLLLLDARKAYGLASAMTPDVSHLVCWFSLADLLFTAMRRVLHLKMVTQCAMLEDFGIFLVLADKVPSSLVVCN